MPVQHPAAGRRPARANIPALCFASAGLAISTYLTVEHYRGSTALACPQTAAINCAKVTTSSWSRLGGIPVAVLGLAYFTVMTLLVLPSAWRRHRLDPVRVNRDGRPPGKLGPRDCGPDAARFWQRSRSRGTNLRWRERRSAESPTGVSPVVTSRVRLT